MSVVHRCDSCVTCMKKFSERLEKIVFCVNRACEQINLLEERLGQIRVRYHRAVRDGNRTMKYSLEMRYSVVKSALHVYKQYVERKENEFCIIKARIELRMTAVLSRLGVHIHVAEQSSSSEDEQL